MAAPRVAIVGGGLAGTMCALIARSRGLRPVIYDAGRRGPGGRLAGGHAPESGAQFLRASEPSQFSQVLEMLQREGLVAPWKARFGLMGSRGGGFLPIDTLKGSGMLAKPEALEGGGDFCGFLRSSHATTYVGTPSNASICAGVCAAIGAEVKQGVQVTAAKWDASCWRLEESGGEDLTYDALVMATHDPSLAAATVRSLRADADLIPRLLKLADALQASRDATVEDSVTHEPQHDLLFHTPCGCVAAPKRSPPLPSGLWYHSPLLAATAGAARAPPRPRLHSQRTLPAALPLCRATLRRGWRARLGRDPIHCTRGVKAGAGRGCRGRAVVRCLAHWRLRACTRRTFAQWYTFRLVGLWAVLRSVGGSINAAAIGTQRPVPTAYRAEGGLGHCWPIPCRVPRHDPHLLPRATRHAPRATPRITCHAPPVRRSAVSTSTFAADLLSDSARRNLDGRAEAQAAAEALGREFRRLCAHFFGNVGVAETHTHAADTAPYLRAHATVWRAILPLRC